MANNDLTNPGTRAIVTAEVRAVLLKHGAPSSQIDEILDRICFHMGSTMNRSSASRMTKEAPSRSMTTCSIERLTQNFTKADPPRISAGDQEGLHSRFEEIAAGKVVVGDE